MNDNARITFTVGDQEVDLGQITSDVIATDQDGRERVIVRHSPEEYLEE